MWLLIHYELMKAMLILKILLVSILFEIIPIATYNDSQNCPIFEPFDWVAITHLLTADNLQIEREKARLDTYLINESEFISITGIDKNYIARNQEDAVKYMNALGKYWSSKGIMIVNDPATFTKISAVISTLNSVHEHDKIIELRSYFRINDQYLVIYRPSTNRISSPTTVLVLTDRFEIEHRFGI